MKLSIIIPTRNEEKVLPYLINSIKEQTFKNLEIIVADAKSTDKTREIAKEYGCEVVDGGNPSVGRNNGAKRALKKNSEIFVFMDSDIILPSKSFLEKSIKEFNKRKLDIAGTLQIPFDTKKDMDLNNVIKTCKKTKDWRYILFYKFSNYFIKSAQNTKKPLMQQCMFVKKSVYEKIGGFDETIEFGEDSMYAQYAVKKGYKFGILNENNKILISPRRLDNKGFWKMLGVYLYFDIGMLLGYKFKVNKKVKYHDKK